MKPFHIIVATDSERGIARNGDLPWHLPGDLRYFRDITTGDGNNAVIMGRKTWDSIPERYRPLAKRHNIVVSRNPALVLPTGVELANSLDEALALGDDADTIFVVGGGLLYAESVRHPRGESAFISRFHAGFDCDTFFVDIAETHTLASTSPEHEHKGTRYDFAIYRRRSVD